jgi:hypothetical protein
VVALSVVASLGDDCLVIGLHSCVSGGRRVELVVVELNAEVERTCRMELHINVHRPASGLAYLSLHQLSVRPFLSSINIFRTA